MDRVFTFADRRIIARLQTEFIPVAANSADLQWKGSTSAKWFAEVARAANPKFASADSLQGFYACAADGTPYGFGNVRNSSKLLALLTSAAYEFAKAPPSPVEIPAETCSRPTPSMPEGAASVSVFTRIRPLPLGAKPINSGVGRDTLWITRDDLRSLVMRRSLPSGLALRICRFHLVDNVRGAPDLWASGQVKRVSIATRPGLVAGSYQFTIDFSMAASDRGAEGKLEGEISIDPSSLNLIRFRAYAEGYARGNPKFAPDAPLGRFPIIWAMIDNPQAAPIPPEGSRLGTEYLRPK
jgi:hypothetical protein